MRLFLKTMFFSVWMLGTAQAGEVVRNEDLLNTPKHWVKSYLASTTIGEMLVDHVKQFDKDVGGECKGAYELVMPLGYMIEEPLEFEDRKSLPVKGSWGYDFKVSRCDKALDFHSYAFVLKDGNIGLMPLLPGQSKSGPKLIFDILEHLKSTAMESLYGEVSDKKWCGWSQVLKTEVMGLKSSQKEIVPGEAWTERWAIWSCDEVLKISVRLFPSLHGGTAFELSLIPKDALNSSFE